MKKVIIIGATSGIGKQLALLFAANDYKIGITGRRTALLNDLKIQHPEAFEIAAMDITQTDNLCEQLEVLTNQLGGLDLLVLSSGTGELNPELDFALGHHTIMTNTIGFTQIADWAFRYFEKQQSGHLAVITSIAGLRGSSLAPAYNASKAYQINYLEGLRQKANKSKHKISITDIRPGFVDTAMAKGDGQFWVSSPEKAAKQIYSAINRKKEVVYITKRWRLIAILLKALPRSLYKKM
ncbi:SDR family NAD(P)-dependent oxidoreductase [Flavobacterium sp. CAU 1735]|uniref:SDR family NAD(P)-dependent oxidoreductase n=1 Tax=Flavobacterium sp. CAU 1735 TaxID=3140361 RepID=UPI0032611FE8